jgi:WS/DGAT/MGAT family acyltransferase
MADASHLERLTASDDYSLESDDFGWPWDIGAIAVVDGISLLDDDDQVRIDKVRRHVEARLHLLPHFRQVLYRPRRGLGWPLWVDAQSFDVTDHVRVFPLPTPAGEPELLEACEELRRRRLDPSRPLWELWLLPGLPDERMGLFLRLHHAIADGVAGVASFAALLDLAADAAGAPAAPPWTPQPMPAARELLRDNLRWRIQGLDHTLSSLAHPVTTLHQVQAAWPSWRELFAEERAPRTSLNRRVGEHRKFALVRSRLDLAKTIAHAHDAKVNDVVLVAIAGGLRELLRSRGEPVNDVVLRAMVPVSLHQEQPGQARGNLDGMIVVPLPVDEPDPVRLLHLVAAQTAARKNRPHPQALSTGIFRFTLARRAVIQLAATQRRFNLNVANVPGPPVPLYLAGAPLTEVFPVVPAIGNEALSIGVLSYAGQLNLTAVADREACSDVEVFAHGVRSTLEELAEPFLIAGP